MTVATVGMNRLLESVNLVMDVLCPSTPLVLVSRSSQNDKPSVEGRRRVRVRVKTLRCRISSVVRNERIAVFWVTCLNAIATVITMLREESRPSFWFYVSLSVSQVPPAQANQR